MNLTKAITFLCILKLNKNPNIAVLIINKNTFLHFAHEYKKKKNL